MSVNQIKGIIFENYYKRIVFLNKNCCYPMKTLKQKDLLFIATKLIEKIPDHRNAKEHYQSFLRKKNTKWKKQSKIITYQPKIFQKPNHCFI